MKIILSFPCQIRQTEANQVQLEAKPLEGPFFAQDAIEQIASELSAAEQDRLADDIIQFAQSEAIRRSIKVSYAITAIRE